MSPSIYHALSSLLLCFMLQKHSQATKQSYIVYLGSHSFGPNPSSEDVESVTNFHHDLLGSYVGSVEKAKNAIFYSYNRYINGFAAVLEEDEAAKVAKHSSVLSVFVNKRRQLQTTHSWDFLGLERNGVIPNASIWGKTLGEDIIIGNIDTGVWPESKSFGDEGIGPVPTKWRGICQTDSKNLDKFHCNRKLIGARYFYKGYQAAEDAGKEVKVSFNNASARDYDGHGSHTLATAGGNFVHGASVFGNGIGTTSGGSPKAHVAAYKVCWGPNTACYDADILAAFEAAIRDGVDVLSISLGGDSSEFFQSAISVGSFHAVANSIIVVGAAGNSGPKPKSILNGEPWMLTVAASTIDREFTSYVTLGDNKVFKGPSLSESGLPSHELYPLIDAVAAKADNASAIDARYCKDGALDPKKAKGKIVFCHVATAVGIFAEGVEAARAGAVGLILAYHVNSGNDILPVPHVLPASHVSSKDGNYILSYIEQTRYPVAHISKVNTELGIKPAPLIASFSSRGPNAIEPGILKPDITAPGVHIIAAYSEAASPLKGTLDKRRTPFMTLSGTSMSCPHVSGLAGLLKALHPDWSPAAIKSAIMTTARIRENTGQPLLYSSLHKATPFAYGAGYIQPNRAAEPGLVYDLNITDYMNFLCGRGYNSSMIKLFYGKPYTCPKLFNLADMNYPSITITRLDLGHSLNVTRTLTNVGSPGTYRARINAPSQVIVSVEPDILSFKEKGEKKEFRVTVTLRPLRKQEAHYFYGRLDWTNGKHHVRSSIVVKNPNR